MGGLGNQLFQIMTVMALARKNNLTPVFEKKDKALFGRITYYNNFFSKLQLYTPPNGIIFYLIKEETEFKFRKINTPPVNIKLFGYFHSYKYLDPPSIIKSYLTLSDEEQKYIKDKISELRKDFKTLISVHVRRTDYLTSNYHTNLSLEYYYEAMKCFDSFESKVFVIFSDDPAWCRENFNGERFEGSPLGQRSSVIIEDNSDYVDLMLMSECDHYIIANSTFSWWGAYLNEKQKMVIRPSCWFQVEIDIQDLCPPEWESIKIGNNIKMENVYYINLEHRKDRKESIEKQLNKLGWKYTRFNAVQHPNGAIGCTLSHIKLLEMAIEKNLDYIVILEDDIFFTNIELFSSQIKNFFESKIEYDFLFIGGNLYFPYVSLNEVCVRAFNCQTTTGYLVKRHFYETLLANYKEGLEKLIETNNVFFYAIDQYWKILQQKYTFVFLFPATITQLPGWSDVENKEVNYDHLLLQPNKLFLRDA